MHPAICVAVIDLGSHPETYEDSGKTVDSRKVAFFWELLDCCKPASTTNEHFVLGRVYNLYLSPRSGLYKLLKEWGVSKDLLESGDYDPAERKGKPCFLNVVVEPGKNHPERSYANIASVNPPVAGMRGQKVQREPFTWEIGDRPGQVVPPDDYLPWVFCAKEFGHVKTHIQNSLEWKALHMTAEQKAAQQANRVRADALVQNAMTEEEREKVEAALGVDDGVFGGAAEEGEIPF
jgi:hypothetical protein